MNEKTESDVVFADFVRGDKYKRGQMESEIVLCNSVLKFAAHCYYYICSNIMINSSE